MIARELAPEIDRLVLSVNGRAVTTNNDRLLGLARERELESLTLLPHFGDFLLAGTLTSDLALLRMRYWPPETVLDRLDEFETKQLIVNGADGFVASPKMRPLLEAVLEALADTAAELWDRHPEPVATAASVARVVIEGTSEDHVVAAVHRALPEPTDPYGLLHRRLTTLRYIRQHDHAEAWSSRGLTPPEAVLMTRLWKDEPADEANQARDGLSGRGLVDGDPPRLTRAGRELRESIEEETDRRAQGSFDVLDDRTATDFLATLRSLPGETG